jgi:hypothetical protein
MVSFGSVGSVRSVSRSVRFVPLLMVHKGGPPGRKDNVNLLHAKAIIPMASLTPSVGQIMAWRVVTNPSRSYRSAYNRSEGQSSSTRLTDVDWVALDAREGEACTRDGSRLLLTDLKCDMICQRLWTGKSPTDSVPCSERRGMGQSLDSRLEVFD